MNAGVAIGLGLAAASTTLTNLAYSREHDAAAALPTLSMRRPLHSLHLLLSDRSWMVGFGMESGGFALYAAALALATLNADFARLAERLLQATAAMGIAGAGFHAYGVSRNIGGFYNSSQNVLNGPPLPAPPSFSGLALAGLAALELLEEAWRGKGSSR